MFRIDSNPAEYYCQVESNVKCYFMDKEKYYHTGIFTNLSRSTLLMSVIDSVLFRRFNITTLCGPRTSSNTCEIIFHSKLNAGIPDFRAAKDVLERYLDVTPGLIPKKFGTTSFHKQVNSFSKTQVAGLRMSSSRQQNVLNMIPTIDLDNTDIGIGDCQPVVIDLEDTISKTENATDFLENNENLSWKNNQDSILLSEQRTSKTIHTISEKCTGLLQVASGQKSVQRKLSDDDSVILCSDDEVMVVEEDSTPNDVVVLDSEDDRHVNNTSIKDTVNSVSDECKQTLLLLENMNRDKAVTASKRDINRCLGSIDKRKKKNRKKKKILKELKRELKHNIRHHEKLINDTNCNLSPNSQTESVNDGNHKSKSTWQRPPHMDTLTRSHEASSAVDPVNNHSHISNGLKSNSGVGSNIYNPNSSDKINTGLRPIIIDGSNVAISHGKGEFSFRGLQICVDYFLKRGHKVIKVFVPQFRRHLSLHREPKTIANLEQKDFLIYTPSRRVDGKMVVSYDDRYIVQTAAELGGVIVSTDNYRDLLLENQAWKETIEKRLLMFTWVDDILMFPQDPLGRYGPTLDEFLMFPNGRK